MPSDAKARRAASKKKAALNRKQALNGGDGGVSSEASSLNGDSAPVTPAMSANNSTNNLAAMVGDLDLQAAARAVTGVLASHPDARDVQISSLSISFHGAELLTDTNCELNMGRRYGLIGANGCGKSSLLSVLGNREVPIPDHVDIFHLKREMPPSDKTALECVMEVDQTRLYLEKEAEELAVKTDDDQAHDRLMEIYERLDELEADKALVRAGKILFGLGFSKQMQHTAVKNFSGGWRMRISLARALFISPALLLLDEPTNHLDLEACVWLEQELRNYKRILVLISHSQDFLNGVCTNIIHMTKKKLQYFGGNYDSFVQTKAEMDENQQKRYKKEQDEIAHMKVRVVCLCMPTYT
ncbi:ABCF2 [Bugula neritina]|uniref:ABCF2 n=1 Tax=Bugula neritina TaxID=10212 RepID=A0A7J7JV90_BUGNE|nr:ABCF2 [Bugula neritina]